ncbi:MAG: Ig-like domain-containing protein [bacterium]
MMRKLSVITLILAALLLWRCSNDETTGPENNTPVNQAPQFTAMSSQNVQVGDSLEFTVTATDPDDDSLTLSCLDLPANAEFVVSANGSGSFIFEPAESQVAVYRIRFMAGDGALADTLQVQVTVAETPNRAPEFAAIENQAVAQDSCLQFTVTASDPDGDSLIFTVEDSPENATLTIESDSSATLDFCPDETQVGQHLLAFIVSDGEFSDTLSFAITVTAAPNEPPVFTTVEPQTVEAEDTLNVRIQATDPDGDSLILSILNPPANSQFTDHGDGTGEFEFLPDESQAGGHEIIFVVSDGELEDTLFLDLSVTLHGNHAPIIQSVEEMIVNMGDSLTFMVVAIDEDGDQLTLIMFNHPPTAEFSDLGDGSGEFRYLPLKEYVSYSPPAGYYPHFIASDGELADTLRVDVIVIDTNNYAPEIDTIIADSMVRVANCMDIEVVITDPNRDSVELSYLLNQSLSFSDTWRDGDSWHFRICPQTGDEGTHEITFIASDGELADTAILDLEIGAENHAPVWYPFDLDGLTRVIEGDTTSFTLSAYDPDGTIPVLRKKYDRATENFVDSGNGTCWYQYFPGWCEQGQRNVWFVASDGELETECWVWLNVINGPNHAPVLDPEGGSYEVYEGHRLGLTFGYSDIDCDRVTVEPHADDLPQPINFVVHFCCDYFNLAFTPWYEDSGEFEMFVTVSDGRLADTAFLDITVLDFNPAPKFELVGELFAPALELFELTVAANDPDGGIPQIYAIALPEDATFTDWGDGTATLSMIPANDQVGELHLTFVASDGEKADTIETSLTVLPPADLADYIEPGLIPGAIGNSWTYVSCSSCGDLTIAIIDAEMVDGEVWWILSEPVPPLGNRFMMHGDSVFSEAGLVFLPAQDTAFSFPAPWEYVGGNRTVAKKTNCLGFCGECYRYTRSHFWDCGYGMGCSNGEEYVVGPGIGLISADHYEQVGLNGGPVYSIYLASYRLR